MPRLFRPLFSALCLCLISVAASGAAPRDADLDILLEGVDEIARPGVPGPILPFGPDSFAVVSGRGQGDSQVAVAAATRYGKGRVVLFGHGGYMGAKNLAQADTARLVVNAVRWAAGGKAGPLRVGVCERYEKDLRPVLEKAGLEVLRVDPVSLGSIDVLAARTWDGDASTRRALTDFVERGGGLISAGLGWGWKQLHPGKDLRTDFSPNLLFAPMGLVFADGTTRPTSPRGYDARKRPSLLLSAPAALDAISPSAKALPLDKQALAQIGATLGMAESNLPETDTLFRPRLASLLAHAPPVCPSTKSPVAISNALGRLLATRETRRLAEAPPGELGPHPSAAEFPGSVPDGARRVARSVEIDLAVPRWHSTGLYAAPGETIVVEAPEAARQAGLHVRIGSHKDAIWGRDKWKRMPVITRRYPLRAPRTEAACAFGGLVYVEVPKGKKGRVTLTIENAVEAPLYILGRTDARQWRDDVRKRPAPWGELATDKMILTLPSSYLRGLDDPAPVLRFWDDVMDACADLAARPRERQSPERFVADIQISAGYMHSGYPLMCHLPQAADFIDLDKLRKGRWGFFHEIGHNHQSRDWTFAGTTEVTVNLFALYVYDKVCGIAPGESERFPPDKRRAQLAQFQKDGKKPPFTYLLMYVQMQEAFGWEAFRDVFAEYRKLPAEERPKTDPEKRDQWLVRFSQRVGRNLAPFFQFWGVETSTEAQGSVAHLPDWMPAELRKGNRPVGG